MKGKTFILIFLVLALVLLTTGAIGAQGPQPPQSYQESPHLPKGPFYQLPEGLWYMTGSAERLAGTTSTLPQATGGPDDFGYWWDDSVGFNWIDAVSGGTDTGMSGSSYGQKVGPISLPFSFKYYENTYNSVYIAASGYLAFTDEGTWPWQMDIPSPGKPNNVIAPYATPLNLATTGSTNRIYYKSGGTSPNRYFAVEWYQVRFSRSDESFTFEVILYENGDIVFQYGLMQYSPSGWSCGSAGIEDSFGLDGLNYLPFCQKAPSNKAVRFYRPSPSARVTIRPRYQGRFTHAGAVETFQVPIRNTGELGGDTYDISVSSPWTMSLYGEDGSTTLADTDGDGVVDTGLVAQGSTFTVTAKVQIPPAVNTGDENFATLTVSSSIDTGKSKTTTLQTAVPAPFAQVYADDADGAMSLYLVQPGAQAVKKASGNWYYGYIPAVAEMPNGNFVLAWVKYRSVSNVSVTEIEYAIMDRYGNVVRSPTRLTDHSGATIYTYDYSPVVAVAPNGHIGVLWYRYLRDQNTYKQNYNIYFAILDPVGNRVYGPVNLTNNSAWGTGPFFSYPRITATGDNRFVLAWYREHSEGSGWVEDIYYTIRDTNGNLVKDITRFTAGQAGGPYFYYPALASLSNNRVLLAYTRNDETRYAVLDSAGNTVKQETSLGYGYRPDAVQLSDGKIVVAWTRWINNRGFIQFAVLDGSTYTWTAGPITLSNPAAPAGEDFVSVAATTAGAVLTWMDESWSSLYYALVDSNGNILTPPMIFRMAGAVSWGSPTIETSYEGYGNTSYTWNPAKNVDAWVQAPGLAGAPPGGVGAAAVRYGNYGMTTATSGVLTATLDGALTYWNANPMPNSVNGSEVVWNLPDLSFLDQGQVLLWVRVPEAEIGTRYPVTWTLTSAGSESNPNDNTAATQVMVARQVFLSLVLRSYP